MRITILGRGSVGSALVQALSPHHQVTSVGRTGVAEAAAGADALILATPYEAAADALAACGDLSGRVVLDATNPLVFADGALRLSLGFDTSGAEEIARAAPGARIVKAFNQTGFENMAAARDFAAPPAMFLAGDDAEAKAVAGRIVTDAGFEPVDAGPLSNARLLEPLAMLWIDLVLRFGQPRDIAFALTRRGS